ncbi:MAG TPA: RING finger protein [Candidatus Babeliales bacterium]|nr:RING finger protein [Candidatus Babeliales bacterium]
MKKQSIMFSGLLIIASGLYGVTANEVLQKFNISFGTVFGQGNLFDKNIAATQNQNLVRWNEAIAGAKLFVIENCKNLIGMKDSDLLNPMATIEKANVDLVNAIKITRGLSTANDLAKQKNIFAQIEMGMRTLSTQVKSKSFTLDNKKEAQRIIVAVATFVESAANKAQKDITNRPVQQTQQIIAECAICYEEKPTVVIPCKNKHSERICQSCLNDIVRKDNTCPFCREPLIK